MTEGRMLKRRCIPLITKNEVAVRCKGICQLCGDIGIHRPRSGHVLSNQIAYTNPYDGTGEYRIPMEYDHIMPLSKGGNTTANNLQLLCRKCNRRKGAKYGSKANAIKKNIAV